jgi:hypothetical protein
VIWFLIGVALGYAGFRVCSMLGVLCWLSHHLYTFDRNGIAHCRRCGWKTVEGLFDREGWDRSGKPTPELRKLLSGSRKEH